VSLSERLHLRVTVIKDKTKRDTARGLLEAWAYCLSFLAGAAKTTEPMHDNKLRTDAVRTVLDSIEHRIDELCDYACPVCKGQGQYWAPGDHSPQENFYCDCVKGRDLLKQDILTSAR